MRAALVFGEEPSRGGGPLEKLVERHEVVWTDTAPVGTALVIHTGPKAVGLAVAPAAWPWERDEA